MYCQFNPNGNLCTLINRTNTNKVNNNNKTINLSHNSTYNPSKR